jgi:hypothetical protein
MKELPMQISILDRGETCALTLTQHHNSSALALPISGDAVRTALDRMLMDPALEQLEVGHIQFVRREDSIVVISKDGTFVIHWRYLFWLVA